MCEKSSPTTKEGCDTKNKLQLTPTGLRCDMLRDYCAMRQRRQDPLLDKNDTIKTSAVFSLERSSHDDPRHVRITNLTSAPLVRLHTTPRRGVSTLESEMRSETTFLDQVAICFHQLEIGDVVFWLRDLHRRRDLLRNLRSNNVSSVPRQANPDITRKWSQPRTHRVQIEPKLLPLTALQNTTEKTAALCLQRVSTWRNSSRHTTFQNVTSRIPSKIASRNCHTMHVQRALGNVTRDKRTRTIGKVQKATFESCPCFRLSHCRC